MAELRERFVQGALAQGIEREVAEEAFKQLQGFATYGFCKSHAAAFALIAYQTLWMKAHYPVQLYCALLNQQPMGFYSPDIVVNDAKRHGIPILRPDANLSEDRCTIEGQTSILRSADGKAMPGSGSIRLGLRYLHGLGEAGRERLLAARATVRFRTGRFLPPHAPAQIADRRSDPRRRARRPGCRPAALLMAAGRAALRRESPDRGANRRHRPTGIRGA